MHYEGVLAAVHSSDDGGARAAACSLGTGRRADRRSRVVPLSGTARELVTTPGDVLRTAGNEICRIITAAAAAGDTRCAGTERILRGASRIPRARDVFDRVAQGSRSRKLSRKVSPISAA